MSLGRLARTVAKLHPLQIAGRAPHLAIARVIGHVSGARAPDSLGHWPDPPEALRRLVIAERARGADRLARLPAASRLRAYESCYGLELGADAGAPHADWGSTVAVEPFPASVRARSIAIATRCGRGGLGSELARAARSVLLQPEVHLLGNHLLENGFALVCAGAAAIGAEADFWWRVGERILAWQLPQQFLADGGHVERSASYHVALTAALLEAIELAGASGRQTPELWREHAARALGWIIAVRAPDGTYPLFNDAALDAAPSIADVTALSAALGVMAVPAETAELAGRVRLTRLVSTGWLRCDTSDASLIVDAGPDASDWQPGHAHADGLTFELWVRGERAIVDYGVAAYEPGAARIATRATRSHNTVELDGLDSCEVWGAFRVGRRGCGRVVKCVAKEDAALVELEHDGYAWLSGAPRHVRSIVLREHGLEVSDRVVGGDRSFLSRLRLDTSVAQSVRVSGAFPVTQSDAKWYPRHGEAHPARLFEQRGRAGQEHDVRWHVEW